MAKSRAKKAAPTKKSIRKPKKAAASPRKKAASTKKSGAAKTAKAPHKRAPKRARTPSPKPTAREADDFDVGTGTSIPDGPSDPAREKTGHVINATVVRRADAPNDKIPVMELNWGEPIPEAARVEGLMQRWVRRGEALLRKLAEHGASKHETRADLKEGRFLWLGEDGRVSAEASAQVLCSWSKSTSVIAMGWSDPLVKSASIPRIDGMPAERDDTDEEGAWRIAMEAAEAAGAEYLYRMPTPHAWYFLALGKPRFDVHAVYSPSTPAFLVLKNLTETRAAIESRAEPAEVLRHRLEGVGGALLHEASYTYRGTDWVSRLERTGRCLLTLATRLPRPSFGAIAAGRAVDEWLDRDSIVDLAQAISLLEDEWAAFT